ncbi:MAG: CotH kinase family protein, partial [Chitinophagaceae bacterium]|nr:CotH kinase family protein [Chitinophagaceae bacterium]
MKLLRNLFFFAILASGLKLQAQITSNLPIVIITSAGAITTTQSQATVAIIDNVSGINHPTDPPTYTGIIGIKLRGNAAFAKKSYSVETWSAPNVSLDTALMGMPSENDWVLQANYPDRTLLRADLAFYLHDKMGRYSPRMKHCEVILNNQYVGVYNFGEQIKRSTGRLDLAKLTVNDNFGHNMTG